VSTQLALEFAERVVLSAAQAAWIEPLRARYANDRRRIDGCEGCEVFGLCALHGVGEVRVRCRPGGTA